MASGQGPRKEEKGPFVSDLQEGMEFIGYFVGRNPRLDPFRDTSRGKYLRMQLVDRTGFIEARMWEECEDVLDEMSGGGPVKVDGVVESYREELQVIIRRMRSAKEEEIGIEDMMRTTKRDVNEMWGAIQEAVEKIQDPHLSQLVRYFYDDPAWVEEFMEAPSARRVHHAYFGGFLEHTYEILLLAEPLIMLYPEIDQDLLAVGILLHDIGKLEELSWGFDTDFTDGGRLLGHIVLGERTISRAIDRIEGFPKHRALEVLHLIVSHHGTYEWGSPRRPKTIEAAALHYLDNLDAQVNRFKLLVSDSRQNGNHWTCYDKLLKRSVYCGTRLEKCGDDKN